MSKCIILTGGGSAGHVTPNIALLPYLRAQGCEIHYIGLAGSIEEKLISEQRDVKFHAIESGECAGCYCRERKNNSNLS